jgi:hypothetical protein
MNVPDESPQPARQPKIQYRRSRIALVTLLAIVTGLAILLYSPVRTLTSLRKVDDHPLYVMDYRGGYLFDLFLKVGIEAIIYQKTAEVVTPDACTCFAALNPDGDMILGRNFDWHNHPTLTLFTDPPGRYASVSTVDTYYLGCDTGEPSWTCRIGLLFAPYRPFDGMNEAGLAVGMMAVPHARDGQDPHKVTVDSLQAIRLLLDHAEDVDEAISLLREYNVLFGEPPLHYLISDASGNSAVIEFIDGEMHVIRNDQPWQVATNFIISHVAPEGTNAPCWRYNHAHQALSEADGNISQEEAMAVLKSVSNSHTIWSAVYDMTTGDVQLAMGRHYDQIHTFALEMEETITR